MRMEYLKSKIVIIFLALTVTFSSCDVLNQMSQVQQLSQCKFDINGVDQVHLAGIELQSNMNRKDLDAAQIMQLTTALFQNKLPLDFDVLLKIDNPNNKAAAMTRMDYELFIDGKKLLTGQMLESVSIAAGGQKVVPMPVSLDLLQALSGETKDAIVNLGFKLTGDASQPTQIMLKVKPYIKVGNSQLAYPGFLNINHTIK